MNASSRDLAARPSGAATAYRSTWCTGLLMGLILTACQPVATLPPPNPTPSVVLEPGNTTAAEEGRAAAAFDRAQAAAANQDLRTALTEASSVVTEHPSTRVSGAALWLMAQLHQQVGDLDEALAAARRFNRVLPRFDRRRAEVQVLEADVLVQLGERSEAMQVLLTLPQDGTESARTTALELIRESAPRMSREELGALLQATPLGQPLAAPLMVAYARTLRLGGDLDSARRFAEAAVSTGAEGVDERQARMLLADLGAGTDGGLRPAPLVRIGAILPESGSPSLQRFAALIEEGIRAAVESSGAPSNVELVVFDDAGNPLSAARAIRRLEAEPVVGVVGPLLDDGLLSAVEARRGPVPLISPTALETGAGRGVYSLGSADPGAGRTLAGYAAESGLEYLVIIRPDDPQAAFEARVFEDHFSELGGSVLRVLTYEPDATYFEDQLRQTEALQPQAMVIFAPGRDIEALASQVSFFGLDTLGIKILGSPDWVSEEILQNVSPRHTNGVVVATPRQAGPQSAAYQRFVQSYEERFQRTLLDPTPALGYDAASLFLLAVRSGARTAVEVRQAMESIAGFEGATGVLSIEGGEIVREHHLICIQDRTLRDVEPGEVSLHHRPMRAGDPDEDEPEIVPDGPLEVYCPGAVPADLEIGR